MPTAASGIRQEVMLVWCDFNQPRRWGMADQARIRVSLATGDLEVEGTGAFIAKYAEPIDELIERLRAGSVQAPARPTPALPTSAPRATGSYPEEFGEAVHGLPNNASGPDQILLAGFYAQKAS